MPAASLLALLDDIATVLDDVGALTKVAASKTAGVVGDDLAVSAEQVTGVRAERELPVVWAVARGSMLNKAILVPAALALSAVAPWAIAPVLMAGGAFLCFEAFEKLAHRWLDGHAGAQADASHRAALSAALVDEKVDLLAVERDRIKGAVRTDFVLSAEIIVIALGTVADASFATRVAVLVAIAVGMTVGVYGVVAGIVKLDDAGAWLTRRGTAAARRLGEGILWFAPWLMKALGVVGTAAMLLVGGGILLHGVPALHHAVEHALAPLGAATDLAVTVAGALIGLVAGGLLVGALRLGSAAWRRLRG